MEWAQRQSQRLTRGVSRFCYVAANRGGPDALCFGEASHFYKYEPLRGVLARELVYSLGASRLHARGLF
jgi:hypothetical protein